MATIDVVEVLVRLPALILLLNACGGDTSTIDENPSPDPTDRNGGDTDTATSVDDTGPAVDTAGTTDGDADGFTADVDCDDTDPLTYPDACEICGDGVDQDCDGLDALCHPTLAPGYDVQVDAARIEGDLAFDNAGVAVSGIGDFDGDGLADLAVGATGTDVNGAKSGSAYLILSAPTGGTWTVGNLAAARLDGEALDDRGGVSVSGGEATGDALSDLIVGAKNHGGAGAAYLVPGGQSLPPTANLDTVGARLIGTVGDAAGSWVAGGGDADGDGIGDLLVGAPDGSAGRGRVYLVHGSAAYVPGSDFALGIVSYVFEGENNGSQTGAEVDFAGDVDGDGLEDLVVGAQGAGNAGKAYILVGHPGFSIAGSRSLSLAEWEWTGEDPGNLAGVSVAGGGDVDGDGLDDVLVGDRLQSEFSVQHGAAYLLSGNHLVSLPKVASYDLENATAKIVGEHPADKLGQSVDIVGDVDCDGYADVLVGADRYGLDQGAAYLIHGPVSGQHLLVLDTESVRFFGRKGSDDRLGNQISGAGDVDGDGLGDLLVGGYTADTPAGGGAGNAFLIYGGL